MVSAVTGTQARRRTLRARDDKVELVLAQEHERAGELVAEEVRLAVRQTVPRRSGSGSYLERAALAVRIVLVRIARDDEEVFDVPERERVLFALLRQVSGAATRVDVRPRCRGAHSPVGETC